MNTQTRITSMISNSDKLKRWTGHDGDNVITEWVTLRADDFDALVKELQAWKVHTGDWFDLEEWLLARHSKP